MASLIPASKSRGADGSVGEALRQLSERVARLETLVELKAPAGAPEKTPAVASEKDAKSKTDAKSA